MSLLLAPVLAVSLGLSAASAVSPSASQLQASPQGLFPAPTLLNHAGEHGWTLQPTAIAADLTAMQFDLRLESADGEVHLLPAINGTGFLVSSSGQVIVTEATHSDAVPVNLRVLDRGGQLQFSRRVDGLTDPMLSADGDQLVLRSRRGVEVLDLQSFAVTTYPRYFRYTVAADGTLAGLELTDAGSMLMVHAPVTTTESNSPQKSEATRAYAIPNGVRRIAIQLNGDYLLLTADSLIGIDSASGKLSTLFRLQQEGELRDLKVANGLIHIGARRVDDDSFSGFQLSLDAEGKMQNQSRGNTMVAPPTHQTDAEERGLIPWPLAPNSPHPIGNTYGEYQNYGGSPYLHPGIDVLGNHYQPVYAVEDGVVKAVLTTSAQYHWRVATGQAGSGTTQGFLYAHLQQSSIAVSVGDTIVKGQYLGDLVPWPTSNFTHVHFNSIEDRGNQWYGDWMVPYNAHLDLEHRGETSKPVFENARGNDLFAFCRNQTSTYRDPDNLFNKVDIIVHIGDKLNSGWTCSVQTLRYSIWPVGNPGAPVVDNKLAVNFDMALDTYASGSIDAFLVDLFYKEDSTCNTNGDYNSREFFHIITNSDGNQVYESSDEDEAWNTNLVPNGDYVIEVVAKDAAGNRAVGQMTVTVNN